MSYNIYCMDIEHIHKTHYLCRHYFINQLKIKKMKKLENLRRMAIILFVAILGMSLTSCGDDDKEAPIGDSSIIGTWVCDVEDLTFNGLSCYFTVQFNSNGTGVFTVNYEKYDPVHYNFEYKINTDQDGDTYLTVFWTSSTYPAFIEQGEPMYVSITKSMMRWGNFTFKRK